MTATSPISLTATPESNATEGLSICCWRCQTPLCQLVPEDLASDVITSCPECGEATLREDGIWRSLRPGDAERFARFIADYELIRESEARGSADAAYYLALPFKDTTGTLAAQWKIRAATFRHMERHILAPLAARRGRPLRILDLGAGNGWLSYRLSLLGHHPAAVDITTNERDGLGAAHHYSGRLPSMFLRVQASLDRLPFVTRTFDLAIFNASFHYSSDYTVTLAEALRCTRIAGHIVIADTAWYGHEESGQRMVEEKRTHFKATYGFASDSIASQEFLTPRRLHDLADTFGIEWQVLKPSYGLNWALRPLRARLAHRRPPSRFRIFLAEVRA